MKTYLKKNINIFRFLKFIMQYFAHASSERLLGFNFYFTFIIFLSNTHFFKYVIKLSLNEKKNTYWSPQGILHYYDRSFTLKRVVNSSFEKKNNNIMK